MTRLEYQLGPPLGHQATFGLLVLRTDETVEAEARLILRGDGVAHYVSRVPCQTEVTMDGLALMEAEIPRAAGLLPNAPHYDVVAYACTSGATRIGPENVAAAVRRGIGVTHVTDPLTAIIAATGALDVSRIGFITPYVPDVSFAMREALEAAGLEIVSFGAMEEANDERVARIDAASIRRAILQVAANGDCDAVFLACTNLRALSIVAEVEQALGLPVITSNQALFWHMMQRAGQSTSGLPYGRLMQMTGEASG